MNRPWNFSAGPATLPEEVLEQAAFEMLDWHASGMSVLEMSHRSPYFAQICDEAEADLRELLHISENYAVLFMQGGASAENAIIPLNLINRRGQASADYVITGHWSQRSYQEAQRYGNIQVAASSGATNNLQGKEYLPWTWIPSLADWQIRKNAAYLHLCSNETIGGVEFTDWSTLVKLNQWNVPLVVDASSHFLSRAMDVSLTGLIYASAQKNAGPAGLTIVIVRHDLIGQALPFCPSAFNYANVAAERSRYNTPPTFPIYIAGLVFKWIKKQGGLAAIEVANQLKAQTFYEYLDASAFYQNFVHQPVRSRMNIPFFLPDKAQYSDFLTGAEQHGLMQLKGHKSTGGLRACFYNAMPLAGVQALIDYMMEFESHHG